MPTTFRYKSVTYVIGTALAYNTVNPAPWGTLRKVTVTNFTEYKKQQEQAAQEWLAENEAQLEPVIDTAGMEHNILFDSVMAEIAASEADSADTWEQGDTSQTWIESAGNQDVTGLAHWQGRIERSDDVTKSRITGTTWKGLFIPKKYEKRQAKVIKTRQFHNIEIVLDKAGRVRSKLPTDIAAVKKEAKVKAIKSKLSNLDRRMAAVAARAELAKK